MKKIKVSGIDKIEIKRMYEDGMGTRKIASNFPFSRTVVKRVLNELNININNKVPTKYKYNYNIFKKIDSKGKAYWLGFLYADGFVSNTTLGIRLSAKDKSHLSRFKEFMGTDKEVVIGTQNSFGTMVYFAEIRIYSIEIVEDLISLGCVENKSKLIEFPSQKILPKSLISHFIRGYFDGDGSISTNGVDNGYKISIIGTKSFLEHVKKYYGLNVKILKSNNIFELKFGGQGDIINFVDDIYQDASYKLKRKYKKSMLIRNKLSRLY